MKFILKLLFIFLGSVSLFLGILGIVIPGLPTTPFLLLSAALFLRSSDYLYRKLITHKYLGRYIQKFHDKRGITLQVKWYSILLMWLMITISVVFLIKVTSIRILIIAIGLIGTIVMGFVVKTVK